MDDRGDEHDAGSEDCAEDAAGASTRCVRARVRERRLNMAKSCMGRATLQTRGSRRSPKGGRRRCPSNTLSGGGASLSGLGLRNNFVTTGHAPESEPRLRTSSAGRERLRKAERARRCSAPATLDDRHRDGDRGEPAEHVEHEVVAGREHREGGHERVHDRQRAQPSGARRSATRPACTTTPRRCAARASRRAGWRGRRARRCARSRSRAWRRRRRRSRGSIRGGATGKRQKTTNASTLTSTSVLRSGR